MQFISEKQIRQKGKRKRSRNRKKQINLPASQRQIRNQRDQEDQGEKGQIVRRSDAPGQFHKEKAEKIDIRFQVMRQQRRPVRSVRRSEIVRLQPVGFILHDLDLAEEGCVIIAIRSQWVRQMKGAASGQTEQKDSDCRKQEQSPQKGVPLSKHRCGSSSSSFIS